MKIKIDQTLHGYQNGHQLLMSSSPLSSDAKKTLLVQSDLSGSNIDEGFKIYISGYPLATHYAFSKTWYADEMKRPGCVWTHTLLIQFPDLGKIPDLDQLLRYFQRPVKDDYQNYSFPILIEKEEFLNSNLCFTDYDAAIPLLNAVYNYPDKTIIFPAFNSLEFEKIIVQIWSNQWPRLRRNFSFCTGVLNLKIIDGNEFDFQVVPMRNVSSIEKQSLNSVTLANLDNQDNWAYFFEKSSKNDLRRFLWFYGSDIRGVRQNYRPLLELFMYSRVQDTPFDLIDNLVSNNFDEKEGLLIKKEIYDSGSLYNFEEKDVLNYFASDDRSYENSNINIAERLIHALKNDKITVDEFSDFYFKLKSDSVNEDIWKNITIDPLNIINLISRDSRLLSVFFNNIEQISTLIDTWYLSNEIQLKIIHILENSENTNWERIIRVILESKSSILFQLLRNNDPKIFYLIKICNEKNFMGIPANVVSLIFNNKTILKDFIHSNVPILSQQFCNNIFLNLNYHHIYSIGLTSHQWIQIYSKIKDEYTRVFASCALLSFGFTRKISNPAPLIAVCFDDVYNFAKNSKINYNEWQMIPIDAVELDDEDALSSFFSYLFLPKKNNVPSWDYCELLIRTLVNKFIKFRWPIQNFVDSLKTFETTQRAFSYALSFKKGRRFLKDLLSYSEKKKVIVNNNQVQLINFLKKEL